MTNSSDNRDSRRSPDDRLIDRLVDEELSELERRELLLRLESEPDGWRRCALAFLEAQTWQESLSPLAGQAADLRPSAAVAERPRARPTSRVSPTHLTALAACLAAAFALGWVWHRNSGERARQAAMTTAELSRPAEANEPRRHASAAAAVRESRPDQRRERSNWLDPLVKQWEQQGFRAERQNRLVSFERKDGKTVNVPVQEVRLEYVRGRTY